MSQKAIRIVGLFVLSLILLLVSHLTARSIPATAQASVAQDPVAGFNIPQQMTDIRVFPGARLNDGRAVVPIWEDQGGGWSHNRTGLIDPRTMTHTNVPPGPGVIAHRASADTYVAIWGGGQTAPNLHFREYRPDGTLVRSLDSACRSNTVITSTTVRNNGDTVYSNDLGEVRVITSNYVHNPQYFVWGHSHSIPIRRLLPLRNGDVLASGNGAHWQVFHSNNTWGTLGFAPGERRVVAAHQRPDGSVVIMGQDRITVYNESMTTVVHSAPAAFPSAGEPSVADLGGGYLFVGESGYYFILRPNNTTTPASTLTFSGNHSAPIAGAYRQPDGTLLVIANRHMLHGQQIEGGFRLCLFRVNPVIVGQTQTAVSLSWVPSTPGPWDYQIEMRTEGSPNWVLVRAQKEQSHTVTGLSPGTRYHFRVRATLDGVLAFPYSPEVSVRTIPPAPNAPTGHLSLGSWHQTVGRGQAVLSWPAVIGATGYKVWVFDGNQYWSFDVGNVTTWNSSAARIYPDPNWLASQADNSIGASPFSHAGGGFALQDNPNILYRKTIGTVNDAATNYWFRVSAYNESGESPFSDAYTAALPNATDNQAPASSVTIASREGLEKTFDRNVTVTVVAQDSMSGVWMVELSNDGVTYTTVREFGKNADNSTGIINYSESFPWALSPGGGTKTVHVRITDSVGNQRVVTGAIALAEDMFPPSIALRINNGVESTTAAAVTLTLTATDNASTANQMRMCFSNDGTLWSSWEPFAQTRTWDLTNVSFGGNTSAGAKKVYAQVHDAAQNVALAVAEIGYNPSPPTGTVAVVGGASGMHEGVAALFTRSDAPMLNLNYPGGASQVRFDVGTGLWGDWEAYGTSKRVFLAKPQGAVRLRVQVRDAFGVAGAPTEHVIVADSTPPVISMLRGNSGATATTTSGATLELTASDNLPGTLRWRFQVNGGNWSGWADLTGPTVFVSGLVSGANRVSTQVQDTAGNGAERSVTIWRL